MTIPTSGQRFHRAAGIVIPLFSLRGAHDAGSGEILDLVETIEWMAAWHHTVLQLLPIHEAQPEETSPYSSLSAFAVDPTYVSASRLVDVQRSPAARAWLDAEEQQRRLQAARLAPQRQRRTAYDLKLHLLELGYCEFASGRTDPSRCNRFEAYCTRQSRWLDDYALFRALKEEQQWASWEEWPAGLRARHPDSLASARARLQDRIRFFQYVQWCAAEQWEVVRETGRRCGVRLKGDLPFVCDRDSADVWAHQELFDASSSAGAPPDDFSPSGQVWGLPLYRWDALRETGYEWWRQRARHARQLYDLFRIDHVVGVYRTYAIPIRAGGTAGFVPSDESMQQLQGEMLLGAVVAEANPDAAVVAEDLGTVPAWVRESLTRLRIPGYKVFRWEQEAGVYVDPRDYIELSVATTGTHDTDTLVTWWESLDESQRAAVMRAVMDAQAGSSPPVSDPRAWKIVHAALLRRLYEAPSVLTVLPIQDLFAWPDRINVPATTGTGNWAYRLPAAPGRLEEIAGVRARLEATRRMIDENRRYAASA